MSREQVLAQERTQHDGPTARRRCKLALRCGHAVYTAIERDYAWCPWCDKTSPADELSWVAVRAAKGADPGVR